MSNLEKYILENRDELDRMEAVPEEALWQKIRAQQSPQKLPVAVPSGKLGFNWKIWSIAALVLALAGWGLWVFWEKQAAAPAVTPALPSKAPMSTMPVAEQKKAEPTAQPPVAEQIPLPTQKPTPPIAQAKKPSKKPSKTGPPPAAVPGLAVSAEERKLQQLVSQREREIGLDTLDRMAYADLLRELEVLELTVEQARKDFAGMPQNDRLVNTLIKYYELKIRILEQISNEINKREYHAELEKRI
ncbi:MAG: hypothetical protein MUC59_08405 [Saprospiraceae bacterium]|jgi:hypothetical protein|nr:hypothetical protein [Saprospiraceae bacterium]